MTREEAYDMIDRYLRAVMHDRDYADYSAALDVILTPLLTPHDAAVLEAAEDVYSDYDESELSTLPTSVRHLWNAVRARRAANAGGET